MVRIVADTLSCISPSEAKNLGIPFLPQIIIFGEQSYRDDTELTPKSFLEKLRTSPALPKTAAPAPALYHPIFQAAQDKNETVLVVCPSKLMSGTYRSAEVAAQDFPSAKIHVFDTMTLGGALGAFVYEAYRFAQMDLSVEEIISKLNELIPRSRTYFLVDTLEYLHKGGRIGAAQALLGSILQVKPILTVKDGQVAPAESQRTHKKALHRIKELIEEFCPPTQESYLCFQHANAEELANNLAEEFKAKFKLKDVSVYELPPAVMVHAGPGAIAAAFFTKPA